MDLVDNWTVQVKKGVIELCILNVVRERECYGYELVKALCTVPGLNLTEGTIYPLLSRLRMQGLVKTRLVESAEGPARKYYMLTKDGRQASAMMNAYFKDLAKGAIALMAGGSAMTRTWTAAAEKALKGRLAEARCRLDGDDVDANEVVDDLRRHVEEEVERRALEVVTEQDVHTILGAMGIASAAGDARKVSSPAHSQPVARAPLRSTIDRDRLWMGSRHSAFGVLLPAAAILVESMWGLCAGVFFDPLPTVLHLLIAAAVPLGNFAVLYALSGHASGSPLHRPRLLATLNGFSIATAIVYSALFLPIAPISFIAVLFGIGLLGLAPMFALLSAILLRRRLSQAAIEDGAALPSPALGAVLGLVALLIANAPFTVTRLGLGLATSTEHDTRANGLALLRRFGDEETLLRACYARGGGMRDPLAFVMDLGSPITPEDARSVYYRVTGSRAEDQADPFDGGWMRESWQPPFEIDAQLGGRTTPGLLLHGSRIDANVDGEAALAYLEWTLVLFNNTSWNQEGTALIALPPGAVVSRLTLWIDGEPREAAFSGRDRVERAYQAVTARNRDPVLVNTAGPDRITMRCFPVPPNGEMKLRIGITAPLALTDPRSAILLLPRFVERSFTVPSSVQHAVWCEAKTAIDAPWLTLLAERPAPDLFALRGDVRETDLLAGTALRIARDPAIRKAFTPDDRAADGSFIVQTLVERPTDGVKRIVFVVDGSVALAGVADDIASAIAHLPAAVDLDVVIADDPPIRVESGRAADAVRRHEYVGACDSVPALVLAWDLAAESPLPSVVIWIHGASRVRLSSVEPLRQRWERRPTGPAIYALEAKGGPNLVLVDLDDVPLVRAAPRLTTIENDLQRLVSQLAGNAPTLDVVRERASEAPSEPAAHRASSHLARLFAADEIARLAADPRAPRDRAMDLACRYQLVTPISGAVVLETQAQYDQFGLKPVDPGTVPTIPEPETVVLLVVAAAVVLFTLVRSRGAAA